MRIVHYFLKQAGIDLVEFLKFLRYFPRYIRELFKFLIMKPKGTSWLLSPTISDYTQAAGSADGHYFWQDLLCAQRIFIENPESHADLGSRVDGFISHLLSFRKVTLIDIRPLNLDVPNLEFFELDAMNPRLKLKRTFESVSSLHALEHFGLGRYGDPLDTEGFQKGLRTLSKLVSPNGTLYISFPIGKPIVHFNSQRIIDPNAPFQILEDFELLDFVLIPWKGKPIFGSKPENFDLELVGFAGLYIFRKKSFA